MDNIDSLDPRRLFGRKKPVAQRASASSVEAVYPSENDLMKPIEPEAVGKIVKPRIPSEKKKPKFKIKKLFNRGEKSTEPEEAKSAGEKGMDNSGASEPEENKETGSEESQESKVEGQGTGAPVKGFVLETHFGKKIKFNFRKSLDQLFNPKFENATDPGFEIREISTPQPGVPQREIDITYEVKTPFQYAHVYFNGEELVHEGVEPPLSEGEKKYLEIIGNAFERMSSSDVLVINEAERKEALRDRFSMIINIYRLDLTKPQRQKMFYYLLKKYTGYGKIDLLMNEPYVEDISCNGPGSPIYINHRFYGSIKSDVVFEEVELNNFVMKIAQVSGRHISVLQPIRDATLPDGSRANLTLGREVTKKGSTFTIRRFKSNPISAIELIRYGTFDSLVLAYLWVIIEYKRSILAAGGTASGKTTTLNALGAFIPHEYKIVSIEDTAELNLMHPNWTQSVTRVGFGGDGEGKSTGDIELFDLLKAALRQRPEYIFVGEVRGAEAGTLFQAISVGHPCMGTIHAGTIQELLSRVESEPMNVPRNLFASLDVVIFNSMVKRGEHFIRRVMRIVEIAEFDPEKGDLVTNPVFKWNAIKDTYEFGGSSAMFMAISDEFGIQVHKLIEEMHLRANILDWLYENNIVDYANVAKAIREYVRNKDALEEIMG